MTLIFSRDAVQGLTEEFLSVKSHSATSLIFSLALYKDNSSQKFPKHAANFNKFYLRWWEIKKKPWRFFIDIIFFQFYLVPKNKIQQLGQILSLITEKCTTTVSITAITCLWTCITKTVRKNWLLFKINYNPKFRFKSYSKFLIGWYRNVAVFNG